MHKNINYICNFFCLDLVVLCNVKLILLLLELAPLTVNPCLAVAVKLLFSFALPINIVLPKLNLLKTFSRLSQYKLISLNVLDN